MIRTYIVKRYVVEVFEVEFDSTDPPTRQEVASATSDPHTITVLRETIKSKSDVHAGRGNRRRA